MLKLIVKQSIFFCIMSNTDCNIQRGGPHLDPWRAAGWKPLLYMHMCAPLYSVQDKRDASCNFPTH